MDGSTATLVGEGTRWTMMTERISCLCPKCKTKYRVPASAEGHHARCRACGATFRVVEKLLQPPTEDDILRWLRDAEEHSEEHVEGHEEVAADETQPA